MKEEWVTVDGGWSASMEFTYHDTDEDRQGLMEMLTGGPALTQEELEKQVEAAREQSKAEADVRRKLEELRAEAKERGALKSGGGGDGDASGLSPETQIALVFEKKRHRAEMDGLLDSLDQAEEERLALVAENERLKPQIMRTVGELERVADGVPVYGRWYHNERSFVAVRGGLSWLITRSQEDGAVYSKIMTVEEVFNLATHGITWVLPVPLVAGPMVVSVPDVVAPGPVGITADRITPGGFRTSTAPNSGSLKKFAKEYLSGPSGAPGSSGINVTFNDLARMPWGETLRHITAAPIAPRELDRW